MSSLKRRSDELLQAARNHREQRQTTDVTIHRFLQALDTPRSLAIWLLYKNKEHDQLTAMKCFAKDYNCPFRFRDDYSATEFLSKASFLKTTFDRKSVALAKFEEFESLCGQTNFRFKNPHLDPLYNGSSVWLLNATKQKIMRILGEFDLEEFIDGANWGPGVTTLVKGEHVSAINKFHEERGITRDLCSLIESWFPAAYPLWAEHLSRENGESMFDIQVGNVIVTVPKNSATDRVIAIEPGINQWFQKALGRMIRRRLLRFGIDLNSQSLNQRLALEGSLTQLLATVDFSSASDSIASAVVEELIPHLWLTIMKACRSNIGVSSNGPRRWNKFSSMGNGFTFELESLIFFAAALAVEEYHVIKERDEGRLLGFKPGRISVFGDDVILPSSMFELFSSFSTFLGFRVNQKKSFSNGYFRESCGSHYFDGVDCKPIYLKERLVNVEGLYKLANGIRLLAHRRNSNYGCDDKFLEPWHYLYYRIPENLRFFVPIVSGDVGLIGNFDEASPSRARYGHEGYRFKTLTSIGVTREHEGQAVLLARLWGGSTLEQNNKYALRGRTRRKINYSEVKQWYNLGPWM